MTPNESLRNVGKAIWKVKNIEITLLHVNVTCYLIFKTLKNAQNLKIVITHQSYKAV